LGADLALWLESELWPTLLDRTAARGVPIVLIQRPPVGRECAQLAARPAVARAVLARFAAAGAERADAAHLGALAGTPVPHLGISSARRRRCLSTKRLSRPCARASAGRPIWLAASTHDGGGTLVAGGARAAGPRAIRSLDHPSRRAIRRAAPRSKHRSAPPVTAPRVAVGGEQTRRARRHHIVDSSASSGCGIAWSRWRFVGGSLVPLGGHQPLEPARLGLRRAGRPRDGEAGRVHRRAAGGRAPRRRRNADALVGCGRPACSPIPARPPRHGRRRTALRAGGDEWSRGMRPSSHRILRRLRP